MKKIVNFTYIIIVMAIKKKYNIFDVCGGVFGGVVVQKNKILRGLPQSKDKKLYSIVKNRKKE
jgi:hypothetical protein